MSVQKVTVKNLIAANPNIQMMFTKSDLKEFINEKLIGKTFDEASQFLVDYMKKISDDVDKRFEEEGDESPF